MKYRVNMRVTSTYQVDVDCDFEDISKAAKEQCKKEYGVDASDEFELEEIEKIDE